MSSILRFGASIIVLSSALLMAACGGSEASNNAETTPPTLSLPGNLTVSATGAQGATVNYTVSATDPVDGPDPVTCTPAAGSTFPIGATTVSCSATNKAGHTATGSFTVTVADKSPPVLSLSSNLTATATSASGATVTFSASATDTVDGTDPVSCTPASGSTFPIGATTVNCTATDKAGNTANGSFTVTVSAPNAGPTLSLPMNMTVAATTGVGTGTPSATVTFTATSTDLIDGTDSVTCAPASGDSFPMGTTTVHCSSTNQAGHASQGSFTVTVPKYWISAGYFNTCATEATTGFGYCWGWNQYGQIGNGTSGKVNASLTAQQVLTAAATPLANVLTVSSNYDTACALVSGGTGYCWGDAQYGQVGNNQAPTSLTLSPYATQIVDQSGSSVLTGIGTIPNGPSINNQFSCALVTGGTVQCWGNGVDGALGNGTYDTSSAPVSVLDASTGQPLQGVVSVASGESFACALINDGTVKCWGDNSMGELGYGYTDPISTNPVPVEATEASPVLIDNTASAAGSTPLTHAVAITAGSFFACALINDGSVQCWGNNNQGELGNGVTLSGTLPPQYNPVTVVTNSGATLGTATALSAGTTNICALLQTGTVDCWGADPDGQLGNNVSTGNYSSAVPVQIDASGTLLSGVVAISTGGSHACATISGGTAAMCWGFDNWGQLGDDATAVTNAGGGTAAAKSALPVSVTVLPP